MVFAKRNSTFLTEDIAGETLLFKTDNEGAREGFVIILNETGGYPGGNIR